MKEYITAFIISLVAVLPLCTPAFSAEETDEILVDGLMMETAPGTEEERKAVLVYSSFTLPDSPLFELPVHFTGVVAENALTVSFDGQALDEVDGLNAGIDGWQVLRFEASEYQGLSGELILTLANNSLEPSVLFVPESVDIPRSIMAQKPSPGSSGNNDNTSSSNDSTSSGGAFGWVLALLVALGWYRRTKLNRCRLSTKEEDTHKLRE